MFSIFIICLIFGLSSVRSTTLSPLCDRSVTNLTIDSTVLLNNSQILFFTDWFVTVVDISDDINRITVTQNITEYFDFGSNLDKLEIPIDMAYINHNDKSILNLRTKV